MRGLRSRCNVVVLIVILVCIRPFATNCIDILIRFISRLNIRTCRCHSLCPRTTASVPEDVLQPFVTPIAFRFCFVEPRRGELRSRIQRLGMFILRRSTPMVITNGSAGAKTPMDSIGREVLTAIASTSPRRVDGLTRNENQRRQTTATCNNNNNDNKETSSK